MIPDTVCGADRARVMPDVTGAVPLVAWAGDMPTPPSGTKARSNPLLCWLQREAPHPEGSEAPSVLVTGAVLVGELDLFAFFKLR